MTVDAIKNELTSMGMYARSQKNPPFKTYKQGYLKAIQDLCRYIERVEYIESLDEFDPPADLAQEHTEFRCSICRDRNECPAYNSGVAYPCAHFKEESNGTEK